ncbi:magnesium chelatase subunit D family protein [Candidatus Methanodesulfokora washburnensis]|uniref:VWA domain-containing protein n=1 Tax=Candidatus Methanodesulfokora washburnensis TaxID=2478471 RepID=A0A429GJX4_9CREN|nr:magnesium chelatase subunit D family protein [Candidatus Methanodesulfokores washburnensis]RSN74125.1 VWA domain-containing protein [Candidatus Methanodesulfokores washburnensis]
MPHHIRFVFPFTAIVGQEKMKKALLLNAVNPRIGGVLIRGQKGTGKSTAVRALAELLPEIKVVKDCPFNCNPDNPREMCDSCYNKYTRGEQLPWVKRKVRIVNLPLNATVDRVVGTLNIERALKEGLKALDPGLLAEANRGILYVDEVNLLDDYVADVLLDVAASGVNIVERENISVMHPSRFILIGTMNPEEGELRPQLLDRFGLQVEVEPITDPAMQIEIVKRAEEFEADPLGFIAKYEEKQRELRLKIEKACELLPKVQISNELLYEIASVCSKLSVSNRAPIVITRTAKTIAALSERTNVNKDDVLEAMELALPHRMRKKPFEQPYISREKLEEIISKDSYDIKNGQQGEGKTINLQFKERVFNIGPPFSVNLETKVDQKACAGKSGRTIKSTGIGRGSYIYSTIPKGKPCDIAIDATIRAAASRLAGSHEIPLKIMDEDIREKVRRAKTSSLITFVVDASGSMAARKRMEAAKGAVLGLLLDAYRRRDKIAFIAFRGKSSEVLLPPTNSIDLAEKALAELPTGGKTPLSHALLTALNLIGTEKRKHSNTIKPIIVLITDGKANVSLSGKIREEIADISNKIRKSNIQLAVVDVSESLFTPNYIKDIVEAANARHIKIENLTGIELQRAITELL